MARIFMTGFETGSILMFDVNQSGTIITSGPTPPNGTYALQHTSRPGAQATLKAAASHFFFRAHWYHDNGSSMITMVQFPNSGGSGFESQVGFGLSNGKVTASIDNRTIVGTGSIVLPVNTWNLVEAEVVISTTVGTITTKVNGTTDLTLTGLNTNKMGGGVVDRVNLISDTGNMNGWSDDWVVNDNTGAANNTFAGEGNIQGLIPNAAGDHTGLTIGGSSPAATNWQGVAERPPDDGVTFNYDGSAVGSNIYDLYNLSNSSNVGSVNALVAWIRAEKDAAGTGNFRFVYKTHATEYRSAADIALSQSWVYYSEIQETNQNTAAAWTATELDALQAGFDAR